MLFTSISWEYERVADSLGDVRHMHSLTCIFDSSFIYKLSMTVLRILLEGVDPQSYTGEGPVLE